jgi:predicted RecA/RadA family phage recombinase
MKTYRAAGRRLAYTNAGGAIVSGAVVALVAGASGYLGIAVTDIAATTGQGELETEGVHELTALSTATWSVGQTIYWDVGNSRLTNASTGNTRAGRAATAKISGPVLGQVKLNEP